MSDKSKNISKRLRLVKDGVFEAEVNEFLSRALSEDGYAGVDVRKTSTNTQVVIHATRSREVIGDKGRRLRELMYSLSKRFGMEQNELDVLVARVANRGLCATAQAESLRYKLLHGVPVRRACFGMLRQIMENGAEGVELAVSGKVRLQRAKTMKFTDGYVLSTGAPVRDYVTSATRCVKLRQGMLGVKVKIMLPYDVEGAKGPKERLPDSVIVHEPKTEPAKAVVKAA